jgi:Uma2 family endonuclease
MSAGTARVTAEDLLAMPDDGIERWIKDGELREGGMTIRNVWHSETLSLLDFALRLWLRTQPRPRGKVLCGEAGVRLRRDPELTVGIDLVYIGPELAQRTPSGGSTIIDGIPVLAAEVLSPSDKQEEVDEKIDAYLGAGVPVVWTLNVRRKTVTVFRPGHPPVMFNATQELLGDPELPGFRVPVLALFEDTEP